MDILEHTYVGESKQERSQRKGTEKDFASISYLSLAGLTWKVPIETYHIRMTRSVRNRNILLGLYKG